MAFPIRLAHAVPVWRGDPLSLLIRCWADRVNGQALDMSVLGSLWGAEVRYATSQEDPTAVFGTDLSLLTQGSLSLSLDAPATQAMTKKRYRFDVQALDVSRVTLLVADLVPGGDYTRQPTQGQGAPPPLAIDVVVSSNSVGIAQYSGQIGLLGSGGLTMVVNPDGTTTLSS